MYQGQMQQQQYALPVPADRLQGQFLNIQLGHPPYVPQNLQLNQYEAQFVPTLCSLLVMEIQNKSRSNALRTFMFNLFSQNNYANQFFDSLAVGTIEFIQLGVAKRVYMDFQNGMQDAVSKVTEMMAANLIRQFQGVAAYLPQQLQQPLMALMQQYDATVNEISQFKQSLQRQMMGGTMQPMGMGGGMMMMGGQPGMMMQQQNNAGAMLSGSTGLFTTGNTGSTNASGRMGRNMADDGGSPFDEEVTFEPAQVVKQPFQSRQEAPVVAPAPVIQRVTGDFEFDNTWEDDSKPASLTAAPQQPEEPVLVSAAESDAKFIGNAKQPYGVAYNPNTHVLFHQIGKEGNVGLVIKPKGDIMDLAKLETRTVAGDTGMIGVDAKATDMNAVWGAVDAMRNVTKDDDAVVDPEDIQAPDVTATNELDFHTSLDAAVLAARIAHHEACTKAARALPVFETYSMLIGAVPLMEDYNAILEELGKLESYLALNQRLNELRPVMNDKAWYMVNATMTLAINKVLRHNLGIDGLDISNFNEDIEKLFPYLEGNVNYGGVIYNGFVNNQKDVIARALGSLNAEDREMIKNEVLAAPEGDNAPKFNIIGETVSITLLDCRLHELNLDLEAGGAGVAVISTLVPDFYKLVEGIILRGEAIDHNFSDHLIVTNDLRVLKVDRGHLNRDFFIVSLAK